LLASAAHAQEGSGQQETPDLAQMEANLAQMWESTLALDDSTEPMWRVQAFSVLIQTEFILERLRAAERGVAAEDLPSDEAARERVLARWRRERPNDVGPDLFAIFEMQQPAEKLAAMLHLLDRHPDDALLLSTAQGLLRDQGQAERAGQLLEGYLERNPEKPLAWRMLADHYGQIQNETRRAELVALWVQQDPPHYEAVSRWLALPIAKQDPRATAAVLDRFFASSPGEAALGTCLAAGRLHPAYRSQARACVARTAAAGEDASPIAKQAAEQARSELVSLAVKEGDWDGLLAALDQLPPAMRRSAVIGAASNVETPAGCDSRVDLLRVAIEGAGGEDPIQAGDDARRIASALKECAARPAATAMFLELVRAVPNPGSAVGAWVVKFNGVEWRGDLPAEVVPILEARLDSDPDAQPVFEALDIAYQAARDFDAHAGLLRRWERQVPDRFPAEQAVVLADYLAMDDHADEAVALLQRTIERSGVNPQPVVALWELYHELDQGERAARLAADLLANGGREASTGHRLAGRGALLAGDLVAAERHYAAYLTEIPSPEVAVELLRGVASLDAPRLAATARRLCEDSRLRRGDDVACAASLLGRAGQPQAAAALVAGAAAGKPEDLRSLRELASNALRAQQWDLAERLQRQILQLDPKSPDDWVQLGGVLEKRSAAGELETLLAEARQTFPQPPNLLLRAAGRALAAAGSARRGLELLREARRELPAGWDAAYVDAELREAYLALGREGRVTRAAATTEEIEERQRAAQAGDLEAILQHTAATLTVDNSGEPCQRGLVLLERVARAGDRRAEQFLGRLLYYGRGRCVEAAPERSLEWLRAGAEAGQPDAQYDLGLALVIGNAGPRAPAEGVGWLEKAVRSPHGHRIGAETLALVYAGGLGVRRDVAKARTYAAEAARLGSDGFPVLGDESRRFPVFAELFRGVATLLEPLAAAGDAAAAGLLGRLHYHGWGVPYDGERALRLVRAGAAGGDALAMRLLAHAYATGGGVAQDPAEAVRWHRRGAEAGDSFCMMFYSQALQRGEAVPSDPTAALAWLEKSGQAGNYWAVGDLGHLYDEGWMGVPRDEKKAALWKQRRAALGDEEARGWLVYHGYPLEE
jgi:TPR repeat protein/predicted Zn-dependent protease